MGYITSFNLKEMRDVVIWYAIPIIGKGDPVSVLAKKEEIRLLSGNEAIARGAFEAGVKVASAYPGTPSTEILENFVRFEGVYAEWAPNEKDAAEVAIGASMGGGRALAAMKHVGVNVGAEPIFTASYTGVRGGLVIVTADDPELHSSQNEQDNRHYAVAAKIPMLEPSDSPRRRSSRGWPSSSPRSTTPPSS